MPLLFNLSQAIDKISVRCYNYISKNERLQHPRGGCLRVKYTGIYEQGDD